MSGTATKTPEPRSYLDRYFSLQEKGSSVKTELIASFTTFLTMIYVIFVNPQILSHAGMNEQAVFVTTCIITAIGCILMGLIAKLPIALAPGMGINAYFAFVLAGGMGLSWQTGMAIIFLGATGFFLLSLFNVRYWMVANIPLSLRIGIGSGCGLLIALIGLHNAGIIVANPDTMVTIGNVKSISFALSSLGFLLICVFAYRKLHAAILISFIVVTLIGWLLGDVTYQGVASFPPDISPVFGQLDLTGALNISLVGIIVSVMLINLFESSGTLIAVTDKAGLVDEQGRYPNQKKSLYIDSACSMGGAFMGTSAVTAYIESASGVAVGGRSGLMAIGVGILFLLAMFFSPLAKMVPPYATAGALIYVGVLMVSELVRVQWNDLTEAVPAFVATVMMPFSFTITEGIASGFIAYTAMKIGTGRWRDISLCTAIMTMLFLGRYIFL